MFSHFVIASNDPADRAAFYDAVLPLLGYARQPGDPAELAYAHRSGLPWIVVARPNDGRPAEPGNGYHLAFHASDEKTVQAFHKAALAAGGRDEGGPGLRPHYAEDYYAAYVRDPDGNKLQAVTYPKGRKAGPGGTEISHLTLGSDDLTRAAAFYRAVLAPFGLARLPEEESEAEDVAFGHPGCALPVIFPQNAFDGRPAKPPHGSIPVLSAANRAAVEAFHLAGLDHGGQTLAEPGVRADALSRAGQPQGFSAGLADPDGNPLFARCATARPAG
ncbi:VOC family protein [Pelagibius sp. 7325]|uniref:VOC family protein n=1 Tax=Pelagibius sp. 7325 TaxID=3131994 RepID=UPI0030EC43C7